MFLCQNVTRQRLEKVRALLTNGSRQNGSRELVLSKSMDKMIVSDDATGDEESVEELPEVSNYSYSIQFLFFFFSMKFLEIIVKVE